MKNLKIAVIIVVASLGGILAAHSVAANMINEYGEEYFADRFLPGTYINGVDCSLMTAAQAKSAMQGYVENYTLEIAERGGSAETITGEQLGLEYQDNGSIDELLADQDTELWFYYLNSRVNHKLPTSFNYDENYVPYLLEQLQCMNEAATTAPADAYIDENEEGFYIVPEVEGNKVDEEKLTALVLDALDSAQTTIDLDAAGVYLSPVVTKDDPVLVSSLERTDKLLSADITYDFSDRQWHADKDVIRTWLVKNTDGSYVIDETKVKDWVYDMAEDTDTFGLPRTFMTSYGVEIELEGGGDYGWCIDSDSTAAALVQYIYQGAQLTIQPDYLYTANDRSLNDIGNTYVEVCISTQTLWYYYEGELLTTTPIISGCVNLGRSTPSGSVWAIDAKKNDWEFTTFPGAFSEYWMPFNDQVGLHDASWQAAETYVVETYIDGGSHGCVNTPLEPMRIVFGHSEIGDPVVVYYSTEQVHGPDPWEELIAG